MTMTNTTPVEKIRTMPKGAQITEINGVITRLDPLKQGKPAKDNKPSTFQNGEFKDMEGAVIPITFKDIPEIHLGCANRIINIRAAKNTHGIRGIRAEVDSRSNKTVIWVTPAAVISFAPIDSYVPTPKPQKVNGHTHAPTPRKEEFIPRGEDLPGGESVDAFTLEELITIRSRACAQFKLVNLDPYVRGAWRNLAAAADHLHASLIRSQHQP